MKTRQEINEQKGKLTLSEKATIEWLAKELEQFIAKDQVSRDGIRTLDSIFSSLMPFRDNYVQRVLNLMAQGDILN